MAAYYAYCVLDKTMLSQCAEALVLAVPTHARNSIRNGHLRDTCRLWKLSYKYPRLLLTPRRISGRSTLVSLTGFSLTLHRSDLVSTETTSNYD